MATGLAGKAEGRDRGRREKIAALQAEGRFKDAFDVAVRGLRAEAAKVHRRRPRDGDLIYAELTASLAETAARLHRYKPEGSR